ncbi:MAG TPA: hypothetical protein ENK73_04700 [Thiomicrospira sp.]|nr:hypothetical protein [Thiomicrospira sp.]
MNAEEGQKNNDQKKGMLLSYLEFIQYFCLHVLLLRFGKVRQYGFLSNVAKGKNYI